MLRLAQYSRNTSGRDFFAGDLHGDYDGLMAALDAVNFDKRWDRLHLPGDLGDRGKDSYRVARLIDESWIRSAQGNHEIMFCQMYHNQYVATQPDLAYAKWYKSHGGDWFFDLSKGSAKFIADRFANLPDIIRVGDIAVIHGDTWMPEATKSITFDHLVMRGDQHTTKWDRKLAKLRSKDATADEFRFTVTGIDAIVVGHTPRKQPKVRGNHIWLDTGAGREGKVTVMSYEEIISAVVAHQMGTDKPRTGVLR